MSVITGKCGDNLTWFFNKETGTLTIKGFGEMYNYANQRGTPAPWEDVQNLIKYVVISEGVSSIGDRAFVFCASLVQVRFPVSLKKIGELAFGGCSSLVKVTLPIGLQEISDSMFYKCVGLTQITIPDSVAIIKDMAFEDCVSLSQITLPDGLLSIGDRAFRGCTGLTQISLPKKLLGIGESAFNGCTGLTQITIPDNLKEIGYGAFFGCSKLLAFLVADNNSNFSSVDGVLFSREGTGLIMYPCGKTGDYRVPEGVTEIWDCAFFGSLITRVVLPDSARYIDSGAFKNCYGLTNVILSNSLHDIGENAFYNCRSLLSVSIPPSVTYIGDNALGYSDDNIQEYYDRKGNIIRSHSKINDFTIYGRPGGEAEAYAKANEFAFKPVLPQFISGTCGADGDGSNLRWVFNTKSGLLSITGSGKMKDYYKQNTSPWHNYRNLITAVSMQNGLTNIGACAFCKCRSLSSVTIPDSVVVIGFRAFEFCDGLVQISIPDELPKMEQCAFDRWFYDVLYSIKNIKIDRWKGYDPNVNL